MAVLQVKSLDRPLPQESLSHISDAATLDEELDGMLGAIQDFDPSQPDVILATCMAMMARCTEIYVRLVRVEGTNRKAKAFRTMQLQKVMDLIDFQFKGASRLVEVRRQDVDLSH